MKTRKITIIGLLSILMLILAGGLAYAATSGTSQPSHPAVTTATLGGHSQHPAGQPGHGCRHYDGYRWRDGHWCGGWNHGRQGYGHQGGGYRQHGNQGYGYQSYRHHGSQGHGYQGNGYRHHGAWGYQHGSHGDHHQGNGCCGGGWH